MPSHPYKRVTYIYAWVNSYVTTLFCETKFAICPGILVVFLLIAAGLDGNLNLETWLKLWAILALNQKEIEKYQLGKQSYPGVLPRGTAMFKWRGCPSEVLKKVPPAGVSRFCIEQLHKQVQLNIIFNVFYVSLVLSRAHFYSQIKQ